MEPNEYKTCFHLRHVIQVHQGRVVFQAATQHARIGDANLVSESQPIQKAFYQESSDVASLSEAEVQAWQIERSISVEGSSIRPILKFVQSGGPS